MALIVEYHVNADMYKVANDATIDGGMLLELDEENGETVVKPAAGGARGQAIIGVAGDSSREANARNNAYSDEVLLGAGNNTMFTQSRVSDFFNETLASDKVTVYHGGGKFWISDDLCDASGDLGVNQSLTSDSGGKWARLDNDIDADSVAICVSATKGYDSGVPGTDLPIGSMTLGDFFGVVLRI